MPLPPRLAELPTQTLPGGLTLIEAATLRSRQRGLGGLQSLDPELGLEIRAASIHTFTMRFPLDLIWRGRDGSLLRIDRDVPRWRTRACVGARSVIETAAGSADAFSAALGLS